ASRSRSAASVSGEPTGWAWRGSYSSTVSARIKPLVKALGESENRTHPALAVLVWDQQYPPRLSSAINCLKYPEETMQANEIVSGALILAFVTFSGTAGAADIVNKPLAACPAETKHICDEN